VVLSNLTAKDMKPILGGTDVRPAARGCNPPDLQLAEPSGGGWAMIDREILMEPGEGPFDVDLQAEQSVLGVLMRDGAPPTTCGCWLLRAECFEHPLH
jgi:hypothetical protein